MEYVVHIQINFSAAQNEKRDAIQIFTAPIQILPQISTTQKQYQKFIHGPMIPRDTPFTLFMAIHSSVVILLLARAVLKRKRGLTVHSVSPHENEEYHSWKQKCILGQQEGNKITLVCLAWVMSSLLFSLPPFSQAASLGCLGLKI